MNNIIKANGEYLTNTFTGDNGTWLLVGTESKSSKPMECKDEFRNVTTGKRITVPRLSVYNMAELGSIKLVTYTKSR